MGYVTPVLRQCPRYAVLWVDDTGGWNLLALHMTEEEANDLAAQYAAPTDRMTQIVVAKLEPLGSMSERDAYAARLHAVDHPRGPMEECGMCREERKRARGVAGRETARVLRRTPEERAALLTYPHWSWTRWQRFRWWLRAR